MLRFEREERSNVSILVSVASIKLPPNCEGQVNVHFLRGFSNRPSATYALPRAALKFQLIIKQKSARERLTVACSGSQFRRP